MGTKTALAWEEFLAAGKPDERWEYMDGEVVFMSPTGARHGLVIPEISAKARGLLADFGASDAAVLDVIFAKSKPGGKLPFELPSSMEAVRNQKEDLPHDSKDPLYNFGYGLTY